MSGASACRTTKAARTHTGVDAIVKSSLAQIAGSTGARGGNGTAMTSR